MKVKIDHISHLHMVSLVWCASMQSQVSRWKMLYRTPVASLVRVQIFSLLWVFKHSLHVVKYFRKWESFSLNFMLTQDVPYVVLLVGEFLGVIKCFRPKLLPAAIQSHGLQNVQGLLYI